MDALAPEEQRNHQRNRAEIFNSPTYGTERNKYFTGLQINIASPTFGTASSLKSQLGTAGDGHADLNDDPLSMTIMTSGMQLRPGVDPGIFHDLAHGIFVNFRRYTTGGFYSLHTHGGTAPMVPEDMPPCDWDLCATFISYATVAALERKGASSHIPLPHNESMNGIFSIPASLWIPQRRIDIENSTRSTFASQGRRVKAEDSLEIWSRREQYAFNLWMDEMMGFKNEAIQPIEKTYKLSNGSMIGPWPLGPNGDQVARMKALYDICLYRVKLASTMPLLVGYQINDCFVPGIPRVLSQAVLSLPFLLNAAEFTPEQKAQLDAIADQRGTIETSYCSPNTH